MAQWWNKLFLFVTFLLLANASGFKGGAYSNAHHQWGQPSENTFSPRAVQSSVPEVPVSRTLAEVDSSLFTNRPVKRLNLLKFVKGGVSSRLESTSYAQTAPSSSTLLSLPLPLNEPLAGRLTLLHGSSGSTITDTASVSAQGESTSFPAVLGTSGLSTSSQSSPSLYMSSSQETSGAKSTEASLPVFSQENILDDRSSAPGATYNSQGSPVPLSESSGQLISPQGEVPFCSLSQGASDTPDSYNRPSYVSCQSTSDQSTPSQSSQGSSGSLLDASGSSIQVDLSPQTQETSNQLLPSPLDVSSQSSNSQSTPSLFMVKTDSQSTGPALPLDNQSSLSQSILSTLNQASASTSQGSSGPELSRSSGQLIPTHVESGSYRGVSQLPSTSSRYAPGSLMYSNFGALPIGVSSQYTHVQSSPSVSTSTQSRSGTQLMTSSHVLPVMGGSYSTSTLSLKPQGIVGMYAPASPTKYASVPMSSHQAVYHGSGARFGTHTGFASQGMSNTYTGSVHPQGTTRQFAPGSPSSYPSVSLSSPQGAGSQSSTVQSSQKQFISTITGSTGTQEGSPTPFNLQGSTNYDGSLQPQGTISQFASGSSSSYPSVSLSSTQGAYCQSATVQSSQKQFTSSYGTVSRSSTPFSLQGSTTYDGSVQPQGTKSQFAPGSPSYPSASLSSPQGAAGQSATVQSSQKQFTSITGSTGTQKGSSTTFNLQGSTTYGASLKPQGTTNHFASGSSSSYPSVSFSSPQGVASQSATVQSSQKQFTSSITGSTGTQKGSSTPFNLHGSTTYDGLVQPQGTTNQLTSGSSSYYPSVSLSTQGVASQSATVQSSQKQFTSSYGTKSGSSTPFSLQGSNTYGGSVQPQGTTSQFAPGSPSYPSASLSSPQVAAGQSATVQSSQKQFTSFTDSTGTQKGSSTPFNLQGSTTYGASLKPQGTTNQFASGSSSSYPSVSFSSPQGVASQSATVQSSQKQFTSSYGTMSGSSTPFSLQGSNTYGGSVQPQGTLSQFASGSPSSNPSASLSSPQGAASQSTTVQSLPQQFTSSYGTLSGSSTPFSLQGSTAYGGSFKPQGITSQFAPASPSSNNCHCVSLSSPQGVASQSNQEIQRYSVSQSQKPQRRQPSQGIQTSGVVASQGSSLSQSSPMQSRFSSRSTAGGSSRDFGRFVSKQDGSTSYGGLSLLSQRPSSKYTPESHAYAKLGYPLSISSQSISNQRTNGFHSSDPRLTQGLLGVVERTSRLSSEAPSTSPSSKKISQHFLKLQRLTGSNRAPSLGLSAQASPVGMFSGVPQTAQALRESGPGVQLFKPYYPRQGLRDSRKTAS